jgi:hypothetical protein
MFLNTIKLKITVSALCTFVAVIMFSCISENTMKRNFSFSNITNENYTIAQERYSNISLNSVLYLQNNAWGIQNDKPFTETFIFSPKEGSAFPSGWRADYLKGEPHKVQGYPAIVFGQRPWSSKSTVGFLPVKVSEMKNLSITYDLKLVAHNNTNNSYNLAFDIWGGSGEVSPENITFELMIWISYDTIYPGDAPVSDTPTIDGVVYDFMGDQGHYLPFRMQNSEWSGREKDFTGSINIKPFMDYLIKHENISPDDSLWAIEFGTEIIEGKVDVLFFNYEVSY